MRRAARLLVLQAALCACRTAPRPAKASTGSVEPRDAGVQELAADAGAPQAGGVIGEVGGTQVLALAAPQFSQLPRDQRLLAYWVAQAGISGQPVALDQSYRHNLEVARLLRGILSRPQAVPNPLLASIREFARLVWLNSGLHDRETGRKETPSFTPADLRTAALAAQAAGGDLGLGPLSLEYALRALEGPLFDPHVDAQRTVHGQDPTASAVNLYDAITSRDLRGLHEKYALNSRLARDDAFIVEQVIRVPSAAAALEQALQHAAPPQRAVLEPLVVFFRSGEPEPFRAAQAAWLEAAGPVDFFAGFLDRSADPRGRKAIFGALLGIKDPDRAPLLEALAQAVPQLEEKLPGGAAAGRPVARVPGAEALLLAGASGALRPLRAFALTLPLETAQRETAGVKTALFAAAEESAAQLVADPALRTLADPALEPQLSRCLPRLRFAFLALREVVGRSPGRARRGDTEALLPVAVEEARADLAAHWLSADPLLEKLGLLSRACQKLWPQFAAALWFSSAANVPQGQDRIEDDHQRALQLQIWWFTGKGALVEQHLDGKRFLSVPDPARFHAAAGELYSLLREIAALGDGARLADLLERHASRVDTRWRDETQERLRAAGIPRRIAVLPPRIDGFFADGKLTDAQAVAIDDLDAEVLRDWQRL